jgi:2-amino-4-hydroxy-6-hydroxymethyldihydropteridine diphosphokinase
MPQDGLIYESAPDLFEFRSTALVALGGNLPSRAGVPAQTLEKAIDSLAAGGLAITAVSRFFNTPCFPAGAGPDFVNAAILIGGMSDAPGLLARLHETEASFGRERVRRWGMRTLDLDLIGLGDAILPDRDTYAAWRDLPPGAQESRAPGQLILPHPRLQDRAFVLVPLADIAQGWHHPVSGRTVADMCAGLSESARREVVAI